MLSADLDKTDLSWSGYQSVVAELMEFYENGIGAINGDGIESTVDGSLSGQQAGDANDDDIGSYKKIRFNVDFSLLNQFRDGSSNEIKMEALKDTIVPEIMNFWSDALFVKPVGPEGLNLNHHIGGQRGTCFNAPLPQATLVGTDYYLIVDAQTDESSPCSNGNVLAYAGPCVFDNDKINPRAGRVTFCLDRIQTLGGQVPINEVQKSVRVGHHEIVHALGMFNYASSCLSKLCPK